MTRALSGRAALITGANQGFGFAIARAFVDAGADLFLCARDDAKLQEARRMLDDVAATDQQIIARAGDVSDDGDVAVLTEAACAALPHLDVLVNNAGVYGPMGPIEAIDWNGWKRAIEINLYGSVGMCRALVPHLKARGSGKIIQLSGGGATNPLPNISAYAASKAAVVRFAETLAEELRPHRIDVNAIAPGALNTRLLDEVLAVGPEAVGEGFYSRAVKQRDNGGAPLDRGAQLCVFLASAASDGITGKLISAIWDPWESFEDVKGDLETTDIYTLRRIVPSERGKTWGSR